ncbi:MAG TPA: CBS domain-containing protein [Candidatus Thermoplasmatota archaeon]|nr:CBS domain-containing protein [Candidatus Thermoplasmatota archaeon]
MNVRDVMTTKIHTVDKDRNLRDVLAIMRAHNVTKIPVLDQGRLVGIVTDGKIADKLGREHNRGIQTTTLHASSVMEKDFLIAHPDEPIEALLKDVGKPGVTMVPVLQGHQLMGVLTKANLLGLVKSEAPLLSIMKTELKAVAPEERLVHARRLLLDHDIARLPVLREGKLQGIIAEAEIAEAFAEIKEADAHVQRANLRELQVAPFMRRQVVTAKPDMTAKEAAGLMQERDVGALPILNGGGTIQGIVPRTDLIRTVAA